MADAAASKAVVGNHMRVQLPPSALSSYLSVPILSVAKDLGIIPYGWPCVSFEFALLKMEFWFK